MSIIYFIYFRSISASELVVAMNEFLSLGKRVVTSHYIFFNKHGLRNIQLCVINEVARFGELFVL